MAKIAKKTKRYPSDLTDEEWERIAPLMPKPGRRGRPREVDFREVINAVRYLARSGCGWRMLPVHFGAWQTVYGWFRELARRFLFQTIHDVALMLDRERVGREASPSAAVIDSQSVKAPAAATRGYDAGKKIVGRKRHIAVDTDGRLLMVNLTTADVSDSAGAQAILDAIRKRWPWGEAPLRRRRLRSSQTHEQGRLPRLCRRNHPPLRQSKGLRGFAAPLGRQANLRLDDPLAASRQRLRKAHRRLSRHDPRRYGRKPRPKKRSSLNSKTDSKATVLRIGPRRAFAARPERRSAQHSRKRVAVREVETRPQYVRWGTERLVRCSIHLSDVGRALLPLRAPPNPVLDLHGGSPNRRRGRHRA